MLALDILGPVRCDATARYQRLTVKKTLALLVLLCRSGPLPRSRVVAMLWPQLDESSGRRNLRRELARLREAGVEGAVQAEGDFLALSAEVASDVGASTPPWPAGGPTTRWRTGGARLPMVWRSTTPRPSTTGWRSSASGCWRCAGVRSRPRPRPTSHGATMKWRCSGSRHCSPTTRCRSSTTATQCACTWPAAGAKRHWRSSSAAGSCSTASLACSRWPIPKTWLPSCAATLPYRPRRAGRPRQRRRAAARRRRPPCCPSCCPSSAAAASWPGSKPPGPPAMPC